MELFSALLVNIPIANHGFFKSVFQIPRSTQLKYYKSYEIRYRQTKTIKIECMNSSFEPDEIRVTLNKITPSR